MLIAWVLEHGKPPDNLVVLSVANEAALVELHSKLAGQPRIVEFREPDIGNEITAIAAGPEHWRTLSSLPLLR